MKRTKIIATVGPATANKEKLLALYNAGVNIIRFNFSHANYEESKRISDIIEELNQSGLTNLSRLLDTKGPEIRTGDLSEKILFRQGDILKVFTAQGKQEEKSLFCDYPYLSEDIEVGGSVVLDSGLLSVKVLEKHTDYVLVEAMNSATIGSRRHVNLPGVRLRMPGVTPKDKEDILWGIKNGFSFIGASFIRNASNVKEMRDFLDENGGEHIQIISKVENQEAIDNIDEIVLASDGVMVARGDLGIEVPIEKLALYQKEMVTKCKANGKIVVTATHLLETMIDNPFPTRAESSDVFNSVLQKPDCLMLSWETAIGAFPIEAVKMMSSIIKEAEKNSEYTHASFTSLELSERDIEKKLLIKSGIFIGEDLWAKALIILTKTGKLAKLASSFRPKIQTYAFTQSEITVKACNWFFGIEPILLEGWDSKDYNKTLENALTVLLEKGLIEKEDKVVAVNDIQKNGAEIPVMEIIRVQDFIKV